MAKVQKISKNISPLAGVFFVNDEFNRCGLGKLIDKQLGIKISTKGYSYSNLFGNFFNRFLSQRFREKKIGIKKQVTTNKAIVFPPILLMDSQQN